MMCAGVARSGSPRPRRITSGSFSAMSAMRVMTCASLSLTREARRLVNEAVISVQLSIEPVKLGIFRGEVGDVRRRIERAAGRAHQQLVAGVPAAVLQDVLGQP